MSGQTLTASTLKPSFTIAEHTGHVGIVAVGGTPPETFVQAARGMYALMVDLGRVDTIARRELAVEAADTPHLLANWLLELLFLTETEGLVFRCFRVELDASGTALRGEAFGEPLDAVRHEPAYDIKAVTHHMLEVCEVPGGCRARVLFDI